MANWNYSQIKDYKKCPYKYKLTHIKNKSGKPNIYDYLQEYIRIMMVAVYEKGQDIKKLPEAYNRTLAIAEEKGIKFPNSSVGDGWKMDLRLFFQDFQKSDGIAVSNLPTKLKIRESDYVVSNIDIIHKTTNDEYELVKWETSSRFMGEKEDEEGMELILNKLAIENELGIAIDKVSWNMLRYVCVKYGNRKSIRNRRNWVSKTRNPIIKAINKFDEDLDSEALFKESARMNNLNNLPVEVIKQFELSDCIIEYEFDTSKIESTLDYIRHLILQIEEDSEYNPVDINKDTEFFCNMLCRHREDCKYLKIHKGIEMSDRDKEIVDLFG